MINSEKARDLFLDMVLRRAFISNSKDFRKSMEEPLLPIGVEHFSYKMLQQAKELYSFLGDIDRDKFQAAYEYAAYYSLVSIMGILDHVSGAPISGELSNFNLRLDVYDDKKSMYHFTSPTESYQINEYGAELETLITYMIGDYIKSREEGQEI